MWRRKVLWAVDFDFLSKERQEVFWGQDTLWPLTREEMQLRSSYVRNILWSGNLSNLAEKHDIPVQTIVVLSNLCSTYNELDSELSQNKSWLGHYSINNLNFFIEVYRICSIGKLVKYLKNSRWALFLSHDILTRILRLPQKDNYKELQKIVQDCPLEQIPLTVSTYLFHINWFEQEVELLIKKNHSRIIQDFIRLSNSIEELIETLKDDSLLDPVVTIWRIKYGILTWLCKSIEELRGLISDPLFIGQIQIGNTQAFMKVSKKCRNITDLKNISGNRYLRSPFSNYENSRVLEDMLDAQIQENGLDELQYLRIEISKFLENIWLEKPEKEVIYWDYELNIYVRLGWTVDYPEIAEALILLVQQYIERWASKIFWKINIIPRYTQSKPSEELFTHERTYFLSVAWTSFKEAMLKKNTIPMYLSHSKLSHDEDVPSIVSWWMEYHNIKNAIISNIDLEDSRDMYNFALDQDLEAICIECIKNLQALEAKILALKQKKPMQRIAKKMWSLLQ